MKHLLGLEDLTAAEITRILDTAAGSLNQAEKIAKVELLHSSDLFELTQYHYSVKLQKSCHL